MTVAQLIALAIAWYSALDNPRSEERLVGVAQAVLDGAAREPPLDPIMVMAIIAQESSFLSDPCAMRIRSEAVVERVVVDAEDGVETLRWRCQSRRGEHTCKQKVWKVHEEDDGYTHFNTCPAGERGYMQVLAGSQWARAGTPIPGTDAVLSRRSGERAEQLLRPEVNIALGCQELRDHREAANLEEAAPWWDWVGAYNTGSIHADHSEAYATRILFRYSQFCSFPVPVDDGTKPLREIWGNCTAVEEEYARRMD